jgi:hypothetical protein
MKTAKLFEELLTEGGTTPPLARKCQDDWRISLHHIGGFLHSFIRGIKL